MKSVMQVFIHPVTISLLYCFLIISGESSAVFYFFALLLGFAHGVFHSIIGVIGIILLLTSLVSRSNYKHLLDVIGALFMLISLIRFFTQPGADYNYNTFRESVPLILMIVFFSLLLSNLLYHLLQFKRLRYHK